jgi:glutamate 5-kinase
MYDKDPRTGSDAVLIPEIKKINKDIEDAAGGIGTTIGSGGMVSKIKAAKICSFSGIGMIIANSREKGVLEKIISAKNTGTFFYPGTQKKVKSVKKWIAFGIKPKGNIVIDRGAEEAVVKKGKSILPVGVIKTGGRFNRGDTLKVFSVDGRLIAKGISILSGEEVKMVMGKNKKAILSDHGPGLCSEVIHRDCLVVFKE